MSSAPTNTIFCDVDGTLLIWPTLAGSPKAGETPTINQRLVNALLAWQQKSGGQLVIWSRTGLDHARMCARLVGLDAICLAKPDMMIDDADAALLVKKFRVVKPEQFS